MSEKFYFSLLESVREIEQMKVLNRKAIETVRSKGNELVDLPKETRARLLKIPRENYHSAHSTAVAVYALNIAEKLNLDTTEKKELVFSCLVHNIGNSLLPLKLLNKDGKLSEEEWKQLKTHPYQGANLLEYLNAPQSAILTARQHHEHQDGTGYPLCTTGEDIHLHAKICSIADVLDALTSQKPYGPSPQDPHDAIEEMKNTPGKFDAQLLSLVL